MSQFVQMTYLFNQIIMKIVKIFLPLPFHNLRIQKNNLLTLLLRTGHKTKRNKIFNKNKIIMITKVINNNYMKNANLVKAEN